MLIDVVGSTDTVAFSTVGINDPVTSALHIIVGKTCYEVGFFFVWFLR